MTFQQLLDGAEILSQSGKADVTAVAYDSRRVAPGTLFVAMRGDTTDGNRYIDAAVKQGAVALVTDSQSEPPRPGVAWAVCTHGRRALARISANFYRRPAEKLKNVGITGTNGKTTTSFLVDSILRAAGRKTALVGTIEYHIAGKVVPAPHTTPEALELNQVFAQALGDGATDAVMEVSSHALAQERVWGIPFDVAIFTNLTRDHLDFHGDIDEYFAAKSILFSGCGTEPPRVAVINADDPRGPELMKASKKKGSEVWTYGLAQGDFRAERVDMGNNGTRFDAVTPAGTAPLFTRLIGKVNVYNILAASAAALARGCTLAHIERGVDLLTRVPGRFERVDAGQPFAVVVDYAHTDDALRNLTSVARDFVSRGPTRGRVITLFGCGGDRDKTKRPLMAAAAAQGSDFVVLTSDNPRSENPQAIIADVLPGLENSETQYAVEPDRHKAIALALSKAEPGDIVLIAGKGHEKTQTTLQGVFPFDDVEEARLALHRLGYGAPVASGGAR
jgi:UDP-N-acetylmuramoyl-L-alanyl-D-glutamate--2,6-diaminopimelate ligase